MSDGLIGRRPSKFRDTMIAKYGSKDAWVDHMREIAAQGGKRSVELGHL